LIGPNGGGIVRFRPDDEPTESILLRGFWCSFAIRWHAVMSLSGPAA
jgi:hypothetical protein